MSNELEGNSISAKSNTALLDTPPVRKKRKQISYQPKPKEETKISPKVKESKPSRLKQLGLTSGIALMLLAGLLLFSTNNPTLPPPDIAENSSSQPTTKSIQNVQVGDWVKAENPELGEAEQLPFIESIDAELHCVVHLRMQKDNGTWLNMQLLRPGNSSSKAARSWLMLICSRLGYDRITKHVPLYESIQ